MLLLTKHFGGQDDYLLIDKDKNEVLMSWDFETISFLEVFDNLDHYKKELEKGLIISKELLHLLKEDLQDLSDRASDKITKGG